MNYDDDDDDQAWETIISSADQQQLEDHVDVLRRPKMIVIYALCCSKLIAGPTEGYNKHMQNGQRIEFRSESKRSMFVESREERR